ncbi:heparin lyase I family protein [Caldimonas sp. KR1-144]|uniref:heparin lyase I family protein n=1 Tax=Caldimonas sp. KR1-144 TaxID=3400911 RepID=UPI003C0B33D4
MSARPLFISVLLAALFFAAVANAQQSIVVPGAPAQTITVPQDPAVPALQQRADKTDAAVAALTKQVEAANAAIAALQPKTAEPTVAAADVLFGVDPAKALKAQTPVLGYEACGVNLISTSAPEAILCNGTARISLVVDPADATRKVLRLAQQPGDPVIGGQPRTELNFSRSGAPPLETPLVRSFQIYLPVWNATTATYLLAQVHWDGSGFLNPAMALKVMSGKWRLDIRHGTTSQVNQVVNADLGPIATGRWINFVQRFKLSPAGQGYLETWIDGVKAHSYTGPFGYAKGTPFIKQGLYPLDSPVGQAILLRGPWLVRDTGLTVPQLSAWVATK